MSIPAAIAAITVTGKYLDAKGDPATGSVVFTPSISAKDGTDNAILAAIPVDVSLDNTGAFSVVLMATDDPQWDAPGWTYKVEISFGTRKSKPDKVFNIVVPYNAAGAAIDLADVAPVDVPSTPSLFLPKTGGTISGTLTVTGDITASSSIAVTNDVTIGDDLTVTDDASIGGDATVTGTLTVGGLVLPTDYATRTVGYVFEAPTTGIARAILRAPKALTVTAVRGYRVGGSGATVNAQNAASDLLASDLSLASAGSWTSDTTIQNAAVSSGATVSVEVASVGGTPTYVTVEVDYTVNP
jgi:hypothetical protein